jgi:hypothetical protein
MKRAAEATKGPPIPATYDSPIQNTIIEITSTKIQTNAIIKFLLSIIIRLSFRKIYLKIYVFVNVNGLCLIYFRSRDVSFTLFILLGYLPL